jgi:hypothetical protein
MAKRFGRGSLALLTGLLLWVLTGCTPSATPGTSRPATSPAGDKQSPTTTDDKAEPIKPPRHDPGR